MDGCVANGFAPPSLEDSSGHHMSCHYLMGVGFAPSFFFFFFFRFSISRSQERRGVRSLDGDLVLDLVPILLVVAGVLAPVDRAQLEESQVLGLAARGAGAGAPAGGRGRDVLARGVRLRGRGGQGEEVHR